MLVDFLRGLEYGSDHSGVLFRRTYPELEELIKRSFEIYPRIGDGSAKYKADTKTWTLPGGATLKFRYLERDQDVYRYQGHQYTWIGWDELTQWPTDFAYNYLRTRLRSAKGIPMRIRATANPGGPGHMWVKQRFIDVAPAMQPYETFVQGLGGLLKQTRLYVPARLQDNHALFENDPNYIGRMEGLSPELRKAYADGDWNIVAGAAFSEWSEDRHLVKPFALQPHWKKYAALDWGYEKPFSIGWYAITGDGRMIRYRELYGMGDKPNKGLRKASKQVAKEAWELSVADGVTDMVADPAIFYADDDEPVIADRFRDAGFTMHKANNNRLSGIARCHELLSTNGHDGQPMFLAFDSNLHFRRTIPSLVRSEKNPEDVDTTQEDHIYDEWRYACMSSMSNMTSEPAYVPEEQPTQQHYDPFDHA